MEIEFDGIGHELNFLVVGIVTALEFEQLEIRIETGTQTVSAVVRVYAP